MAREPRHLSSGPQATCIIKYRCGGRQHMEGLPPFQACQLYLLQVTSADVLRVLDNHPAQSMVPTARAPPRPAHFFRSDQEGERHRLCGGLHQVLDMVGWRAGSEAARGNRHSWYSRRCARFRGRHLQCASSVTRASLSLYGSLVACPPHGRRARPLRPPLHGDSSNTRLACPCTSVFWKVATGARAAPALTPPPAWCHFSHEQLPFFAPACKAQRGAHAPSFAGEDQPSRACQETTPPAPHLRCSAGAARAGLTCTARTAQPCGPSSLLVNRARWSHAAHLRGQLHPPPARCQGGQAVLQARQVGVQQLRHRHHILARHSRGSAHAACTSAGWAFRASCPPLL